MRNVRREKGRCFMFVSPFEFRFGKD